MAQVCVRIPDELKVSLQGQARKRGVSLNAFVVQLFWDWFESIKIDGRGQV